MMADLPMIPVALLVAGGYLTWYGVHYWREGGWPTTPVKSVLTGQGVPAPHKAATSAAILTADITAASGSDSGSGGGTGGTAGNTGPPQEVGGPGTYSHAQIMQLWTRNGGNGGTADLAAAIAQAESSGRTAVTSSNPDGGTNVGLWQLDTKGVGAGHTVAQLQDPATNARVTIMATANGTNWNAWETWHTGAYKQFLGGHADANAQPIITPSGQNINNPNPTIPVVG